MIEQLTLGELWRERLKKRLHQCALICIIIPSVFKNSYKFFFWSPRTPDSSEETNAHSTHEEYTNETFESDAASTSQTVTTATAAPGSKKGSTSTPRLNLTNQKAEQAAVGNNRTAPPKSPKSPLKSPNRRGSESESEDSFSLVHSGGYKLNI